MKELQLKQWPLCFILCGYFNCVFRHILFLQLSPYHSLSQEVIGDLAGSGDECSGGLDFTLVHLRPIFHLGILPQLDFFGALYVECICLHLCGSWWAECLCAFGGQILNILALLTVFSNNNRTNPLNETQRSKFPSTSLKYPKKDVPLRIASDSDIILKGIKCYIT